jgi:heterodisulfide reductase subunit C
MPQTRKRKKPEAKTETKPKEEEKKEVKEEMQPKPAESQEIGKKTVLRITPESARFKYELKKVPGAERLMLCFQCGTCTADCPVSRYDESYRPRKILRMAQLGIKDQVLKSDVIWLCAACFTCVDHCPQDVEIASVLRALRNMAVKEGAMPPLFKELASAIMQTGYAYRIPESRMKKREETALPPLPKGNLEDIAKLFKVTGFSKVLEGSGGSS